MTHVVVWPVLMAATLLQQPPTKTIPDAIACRTCSIEFVKVVTVASTPSDPDLTDGLWLARNSRGQFYSRSSDHRIIVYDSAGRYLRTFGRTGEGPGELGRIGGLTVGRGDSLWVWHGRKFNVYDPGDRFARSAALNRQLSPTGILPSGGVAYISNLRDTSTVFMLRADATLERQFTVGVPAPGVRCRECAQRSITLAHSRDALWVTGGNKFRFERWSLDGAPQLVLIRDAAWFPPRTRDGPNSKAVSFGEVVPRGQVAPPPPPIPAAIIAAMEPTTGWVHEDANGLLWVQATRRKPGGGLTPILEVLDIARAELLAVADLPFDFRPIGGGYFFTRKQSADGYYSLDVWQLRLRRS